MLLFKNQTGILLTLRYNEMIVVIFMNSILIFLFNKCLYVLAVILKHTINFIINIRQHTNRHVYDIAL